MELYIVRHGQSTGNALEDPERRDYDSPQRRYYDTPLTEVGREQAKLVSRYLVEGVHLKVAPGGEESAVGPALTHLFCSPMTRALQTAKYIGDELGMNPQVWVDIHELGGLFLNHGEPQGIVGYPGLTRDEILVKFPNYILPGEITDHGWWKGAKEDRESAFERAVRVADKLKQRGLKEERIAFVTHGDFSDMLLKALAGFTSGNGHLEERIYYEHKNTAISRVDFTPAGRIVLRYLNRVEHLPKGLLT